MKVFIDAPLLIYLNTLTDYQQRYPYEDFYIEMLTEHKAYTDVLVLDELLYISRSKYDVPYHITIRFIQTSILPYIQVLNLGEDEYSRAAQLLLKHNLKPSDALHLGAMLSNNIRVIASEDREFDRIPSIKRLWASQME